MRMLVAIPVYNEEKHVSRVLAHVLNYTDDVLVIDDGSKDRTPSLLSRFEVHGVRHGLRVREVPVKLIYNDPNRSFGGHLDDPEVRLAHYRRVLHCELERCAARLPRAALRGVDAGCRCG